MSRPAARRSTGWMLLALVGAACAGDPDYGRRSAKEWVAELRSPNAVDRAGAADAFKHAPPRSYRSVHALLVASGDPDSSVRVAVSAALLNLPGDAAPALRKALGDTNVAIRRRAVATLGMLVDGTEKSVPALVDRLGDSDDSVRILAVVALGQMGPSAYNARGTVKQLASEPGPLRAAALMALPRIDTESHTFLSLYESAAADTSEAVRIAAVLSATQAARSPDHDPIALLTGALSDSSDRVKMAALSGLLFVGSDAPAALPGVVALRRSGNAAVRALADSVAKALAARRPR